MNFRILLFLPLTFLCSCLDDELAFTVVASPVNAEVEKLDDGTGDSVSYRATFTELDKENILDVNIGIIATPVPDLELNIYSQTQDLLTTITTDENGKALLNLPATSLSGVTRLEWSGTHNGAAFRILTNL
ncbi:hypothetical protein GGR28_001666 [Lewinella aquimaris]|uniref:Uncharacterized protein n=1 Tax=Neolewinella aquimaris TaxID=1835722 RepID=A0A840EB80_9BACT|nr:hypothetical protein [Neolewinella aquimaris]MBB4079049.1 hypothetical protein [Neolewinella aquimaris]